MRNDYLFYSGELGDYIKTLLSNLERKINTEPKDYILNVNEDEYINHIVETFSLECPEILNSDIYLDEPVETNINVSNNPEYWGNSIKGSLLTVHIPFNGNKELFFHTPSTRTFNPPHAKIKFNEIILELVLKHNENPDIENKIDNLLNDINKYLEWVKKDISNYNNSLRRNVKSKFDTRKAQFIKESSLTQGLRFPIKKRNNLPESYTVPSLKKKINIKPNVQTEISKPYPQLSDSDFRSILKIISNMALVMERSPKTFFKLHEEEIRDHFLMHLNGHFEGNATGETFNYGGKTDILIKSEGKNIFIAECKIWKGESVLNETIDQLLRYSSWRDTKSAIILFNKNKSLSGVLEQIPDICKKHKNFAKISNFSNLDSETVTDVVFKQNTDEKRMISTSIMVFDIPNL